MLNGVNNVGYNSYELRNKQSFQKRVDNPIETEAKKEEDKKNHTGLKLAGALVAAAGIVAGLIVGNKTGAFNKLGKLIPDAIKNSKALNFAKEPAKKVLSGLNTAGGWLATKGSALLASGKEALGTFAGFAKKYGKQVFDSTVNTVSTVGKFMKEKGGAVVNFAKKIFMK